MDEDRVEDVNEGFVNEECLEEKGYDRSAFAENKECSIEPCKVAMEYCQQSDLLYISLTLVVV